MRSGVPGVGGKKLIFDTRIGTKPWYLPPAGADERLPITPAQRADLLEFLRSLSGQAYSVDEPVGTYRFGIGKGSGIP